MALRHRVAYVGLLALALAALLGYVATVVMAVLKLTHPVLGATSGACFICMSPWVETEFLVGTIVVLLAYILGLICAGVGIARHDYAWPMAYFTLLALVIGLTVLDGSGFSDMLIAKLGINPHNILLLGAAACLLLIPLLALFYTKRLRRAWTPVAAPPASGRHATPPPPVL